jgi:murein DD-endopeptidase MepM/ murein hydrolase activator NlpD
MVNSERQLWTDFSFVHRSRFDARRPTPRAMLNDVKRLLTVIVAVVLITLDATGADASPSAGFVWPLTPRPAVAAAYDPPEHDWLPGHRGVDLAGTSGQPVLAAGDGTVVFAGTVAGKPVVSLDHPNGLRTTYEPVTAAVSVGARVRSGVRIGVLEPGHTGCVDVCLHWGVRRGREYLDPLRLVAASRIVLKPLATG